ncbi:MAG: hypothetical protein K5669_07420 [Lachnospiraceae bacterium]|nr:hypothetical protein [Lachnospiraceae bacterium]
MKIKDTIKDYDEVISIKREKHISPKRQSYFLRKLIKFLSKKELKETNFKYVTDGMDKLGKDEPCLILMNHSSFTDLQIIGTLFANRQYHIVCTSDGLVGKAGLMRRVGCIPTAKFVIDSTLVRDMKYTFDKLKSSIVMYPEASYSFDGTQTPLPKSISKCLKIMNVPVVIVKTEGAFLRDPLYNNLQKRKADVKATVKYLFSKEDIKKKSNEEIFETLSKELSYDHFKAQHEANICVNEHFRADGLHRVLYKCPCCKTEGSMVGKGVTITCKECGKVYTLEENGTLSVRQSGQPDSVKNRTGKGDSDFSGVDVCEFKYVTDWYAWERECVKKELEEGTYLLDTEVEIKMLVDTKSIYSVGSGRLKHSKEGFELTGCDGRLKYTQSGKASYSLYADYFWYEIGDMICIGNNKVQYYCFPKNQEKAIVAKARLAAEELYKML